MPKLIKIPAAFLVASITAVLTFWFSFSAGSEAVRSLTKPWISFSFSREMLSYIAIHWIIYWGIPLLVFVLISEWRPRTSLRWYIGGIILISIVVAAILNWDVLIHSVREGFPLELSAEGMVYFLSTICAGLCFGALYCMIAFQ